MTGRPGDQATGARDLPGGRRLGERGFRKALHVAPGAFSPLPHGLTKPQARDPQVRGLGWDRALTQVTSGFRVGIDQTVVKTPWEGWTAHTGVNEAGSRKLGTWGPRAVTEHHELAPHGVE